MAAIASSSDSVLPQVLIASDEKVLSTLAASENGELTVRHSAKLPKKPTAAALLQTPSGEHVLALADKSGEAFAFPAGPVDARKRFLVGHTAAIITCMETVELGDGASKRQFLVTADRDECIRVSRWPGTHDIQSVCRGHTRFVTVMRSVQSAVHSGDEPDRAFVGASAASATDSSSASGRGPQPEEGAEGACKTSYAPGELLVSGGGDGTLRLWHAPSGTLLHTLYLQQQQQAETQQPASAAGGVFSLAGPPVNSGPAPAGAVHVVGGAFGAYGSAGAHCDAAMNFSSATQAGGEGGEGEEGGAPAPPSKPLVIPSAFLMQDAHDSHTEAVAGASHPVFPAVLAYAPPATAGGLLATVLEGEKAVRFVRVAMGSEPSRIAPACGHESDVRRTLSADGALPQARLVQVGVMPLPFQPLMATFVPPAEGSIAPGAGADSAPPPVLLVGGALPLAAASAAGASADGVDGRLQFQVQAFSVEAQGSSSSSEEGEGGALSGSAFLSLLGPLTLPLHGQEGENEEGGGSAAFRAAYGRALTTVATLNSTLAAAASGASPAHAGLAPVPGRPLPSSHFVAEKLADFDKFVSSAADSAAKAVRVAAKATLAAAAAAEAGAASSAIMGVDDVAPEASGEEDGEGVGAPAGKRARVEA